MQLSRVWRAASLTAMVVLGLLAACGQCKLQFGWVASNRPGCFEANYATFSGSEVRSLRVDAGEMLVFEYSARVTEGALTISVEGPEDEILWVVSLDEDSADAMELPVEPGGHYSVVVCGDSAGGSFDLSWKVE
jgi:hypothetical protein